MVLKAKQIKKRKDYLTVMNNGEKIVSSCFIIFFYYGELDIHKNISEIHKLKYCNNHVISFGYTASSKIGNAVVRNKVKRRFKNMVHQTFKEFDGSTILTKKSSSPLSFCFVARYNTYNCNFAKMSQDFKKFFKKYV